MALDNQTICRIILEQLGGSRFITMTGAKNLMAGERTLSFRIPKSNGINHVAITLDVDDTYRVTFNRIIGTKPVVIVHTQSTVYADQLQELFTNQTGLATRL
jgi:hypothetical protein